MLRDARIEWPSIVDQRRMARLVASRCQLIKGRWGFIDGKNRRVQKPTASDKQNAYYNGWLHSTLVTGTACYSADGVCVWAKLNCPGSWNDGDMSREFQEKIGDNVFCPVMDMVS